jgi:hypothetical protein
MTHKRVSSEVYLTDEIRGDCFLDNDLILKDISMAQGCKAIIWVNICIFIVYIVLLINKSS